MIAIVDYGMGNLHSVSRAVERLGYKPTVTANKDSLLQADGIILPGVGAFGDAMEMLRASGLDHVLRTAAERGIPLLGICLGMQLLFHESEEYGIHKGLSLLPGRVVRFAGDSYKVPHMGWNQVTWLQPSSVLTSSLVEGHVYFVHSYYVEVEEATDLIATCPYGGVEVAAIVGRSNVYGMQFHPEKSGELGLQLLRSFLELCHTRVHETP
ncbi:imidazole glycerol phosphate synthase subunit HisH [Paenibacillus sp. 481]|uniref:imidazole glycerol phosphate synthase subunit HisH n=1 Tax=Paenibacillus sp. 481 TaxID=2835869 RepID=UPI001E4CE8ED|nr:imidazole glycerol phosphate synthase subunit HisH [Paenibacillus sp. 481]UHA75217.1 imidazole glycerol phosphate synthase subunit HisH [Paenibacillus sp. 481]